MNKHAYLIMAHNNIEQLIRLVRCIDYAQNDIFIHIDLKYGSFDAEKIKDAVKYSDIYFVKRIDVVWGDYSQIKCEMSLIKMALIVQQYQYLHLLSGVDFCLKRADDIYKFFLDKYPCEFVYYDREDNREKAAARCREYHFLQRITGRNKNQNGFAKRAEHMLIRMQGKIGVNRCKNIYEFLGKGANWFSITGDFGKYLINHEKMIRKYFRYTVCCDEVFLQTMLNMSPYIRNNYEPKGDHNFYNNMRLTDWTRGKPYVFRETDFEQLISSQYMFARKFDINTDEKILKKIENHLNGGN